MKTLFALLLTVALTFIAGTVPALANGIATVGGPGLSPGDWSQEWLENGVGNFDTILLFSESGAGVLFTPGLTDVSGGWTETNPVPGMFSMLTTGSPVTDYYFNTNFVDPGVGITFNIYALLGGVRGKLLDSATIDNFGDGSSLGYGLSLKGTPGTVGLANDLGSVPEPATLGMFGLGLLVLSLGIRKAKTR